MRTRPFAIAVVALVGLTGCFPDPSTEPPATTTTAVPTTTTIAGSAALVGSFDNTFQPQYGDTFDVTATVSNIGTADETGVTVDVTIPNGLTFVSAPPAYDAPSHTWTIGTLPEGGSASVVLTLRAGDVALGVRFLQLVTSSDTAPSALAQTTVTPVKAPVSVSIVADPANPSPIDISSPVNVSWTAQVSDADHPSNPAPTATVSWTCETESQNPCPLVPPLITPGIATLTFSAPSLGLDGYLLTAYASVNDPNYESSPAPATVGFVTTDGGG